MRVRHLNLLQPEHSLALQAPLAKDAGGLQMCVGADGGPVFRDKSDEAYVRMRAALAEGVIHRDQPGVRALLQQRTLGDRQSSVERPSSIADAQ